MKNLKLLAVLALASAAFAVSAQNIATVNGKPIPKSLQDEWVAQLIANGGKDTMLWSNRKLQSARFPTILKSNLLWTTLNSVFFRKLS